MGDKIDVKPCTKVEPPHPCDPPPPCDPNLIETECPTPYICRERLKNPAWDGEISDNRDSCYETGTKSYETDKDCQTQDNARPLPYLWLEKLKNPEDSAKVEEEEEKTRCMTGAFLHVKACAKVEPPHPCDILPPCSLKSIYERKRKLPCIEPPLCYERIKNPENRKKPDPSCDESK